MDPSITPVRSPMHVTREIMSAGPGYTITHRTCLDSTEVRKLTRESIINKFTRSRNQDRHSGKNIYPCSFKGTFQITTEPSVSYNNWACAALKRAFSFQRSAVIYHQHKLQQSASHTTCVWAKCVRPRAGWFKVSDRERLLMGALEMGSKGR